MSSNKVVTEGSATRWFFTMLVLSTSFVTLMIFIAYKSDVNSRPKQAMDMLVIVQEDADEPYSKSFLKIAEGAFLDDEISSKELTALNDAYYVFKEDKRLAAVEKLKTD